MVPEAINPPFLPFTSGNNPCGMGTLT